MIKLLGAAAFKLYNKEAEPASAEAASKSKTQQLHLFFQICGTTNYFQGVRNFRNYGYDAKPGLLQSLTPKHPNLPLLLERIKGKNLEECMALEISKDEMDLIEAIVLQTIEAACLGLISKSKGSLNIDEALTHIKGEIEVGYYWSVVAHSMAEVKIVCDDRTVYRTFFEQEIMME
jgi:hypothetical protein